MLAHAALCAGTSLSASNAPVYPPAHSGQVDTLLPGQVMTIVEEQMDAAEQHVRARVTYTHVTDRAAPSSSSGAIGEDVDAPDGVTSHNSSTVGERHHSSKRSAAAGHFDAAALATEMRALEHMTTRGSRRLADVGGGYAALASIDGGSSLHRDSTVHEDDSTYPIDSASRESLVKSVVITDNGARLQTGW